MSKKRVLLIGKSGFIGCNITESYLKDKYDIISPSSKELNLLDINSVNKYFKNNYFDVVIHSANAQNVYDFNNSHYFDSDKVAFNNLKMFYNLAYCMSNYNAPFDKLIYMGSGACYDMSNDIHKIDEKNFGYNIPKTNHGIYKYIISDYIEKSQFNIVDLRIFGIFGKYEEKTRLISNSIIKCLKNEKINISQNKLMSYLYIDDLMPILEYFIERDGIYKAYNITPRIPHTIKEIAEKVLEISNKTFDNIVDNNVIGKCYTGNNKRLIEEIPNLKFTSIKDGIKNLYDYYEGLK